MRFLVDESTGPAVARWLTDIGHDTISVYDYMAGAPDNEVLEKAYKEERILITNDKDFGEKVYNQGNKHCGVILLRLKDERSQNKINILQKFLSGYSKQINNNFIVITENRVRIATRRD